MVRRLHLFHHVRNRGAFAELIAELFPGALLERAARIGVDEATRDTVTEKGFGYGEPIRLTLRERSGERRELVFHTATADDFGHDRRADRAEEIILAFDTFPDVPGQVRAIDWGAVARGGALRSLRDSGEFYLITEFTPGTLYADDLRRIARQGRLEARDSLRAKNLAAHLAEMHQKKGGRPQAYRRAVRDVIGSGEGIFGIVDSYPEGVEGAPAGRLRALEQRAAEWRWRMRGMEHRLAVIHGDPHPFNLLFDEDDRPALLDASRGARGDPADDVVCLTINYIFFALDHPGAWVGGLRNLWRDFWRIYLQRTGDLELLRAAPLYLAWRALVLASPIWYPQVSPESRDTLLSLAERALGAGRLDLELSEAMFS